MGDALSVAKLRWATGNVGGLVRLNINEGSLAEGDPRGSWIDSTYALTCHHVARPTRTVDIKGENTGEPLLGWTHRHNVGIHCVCYESQLYSGLIPLQVTTPP